MKLHAILFIFYLIPQFIFSQSVNMKNGTLRTCSTILYDSGGPNSNYSTSENLTFTICPDSPNQKIKISFTTFSIAKNDKLVIYHNNTTNGVQQSYSGTTIPPTTISSNVNGCLTIKFTSSNNSPKEGWVANISCSSTTNPPSAGSICSIANPFCTEEGEYNFPNSTINQSPVGPNYGCLSSQPFPIWYYMRISEPGDLKLFIKQNSTSNNTGNGYDIDFALWGPFSSFSNGCTKILSGELPPIQCSYSPSDTENIGIGFPGGEGAGASNPPSALAGQIYILLLTNYEKRPGYITFKQTGGTAQADCTIVPLSVQLESFDVQSIKGANQINWKSIHEQDIISYIIERSSDGKIWTPIYEDRVRSEKEENSSEKKYNCTDYSFENSWNYYRLIELRSDGTKEIIQIKGIDNRNESKDILKIVNSFGQEVNRSAPGLKIIIYTDGSSQKIM